MIATLETSALLKLLVEERESAAVERWIQDRTEYVDVMTTSEIAVTEMRRACIRLGLDPTIVTQVRRMCVVTAVTGAILDTAGRFPDRRLGTLDAIHLAAAVSVRAECLVTYDRRLAQAARSEGLLVAAPGQDEA